MTTYEVGAGVTSSGIYISLGESMYVSAGGTASNIFNGGNEYVYSGGTNFGGEVSDGNEYVYSGGTDEDGYVTDGSVYLSGGVSSNFTIGPRGYEDVLSGGKAQSTTISAGGRQAVNPGGFALYTDVLSGGMQVVYGEAEATNVYSGGSAFFDGGDHSLYIDKTYINVRNGGHIAVGYDGNIMSANIRGQAVVSSGGYAFYDVVESGGVEYVSGTAGSTVVNSGGIEYVMSGGFSPEPTINNGGFEKVYSGGVVSGALLYGGNLALDTGAVADTIAFVSGSTATLELAQGAGSPETISGLAPGVTIDLLGIGLATSASLGSGNVLTIAGGSAEPVTLDLDPAQSYGGLAFNLTSDGDGGTALTVVPTLPPAISGTLGGQATTDQLAVKPFGEAAITDPNSAIATETVTVTPSTGANGALSDPNAASDVGSFSPAGVYTVSGSAAVVTSALEGLIFTPTAHEVPAGQTVTTSFTISDTNSLGLTATDTATSVVATAIAPPSYSLSAVDADKAEGNSGATPFTFTVTRSGDASAAATLSYAVSGSGANPASGSDFVGGAFPSGTVFFAPGDTSETITVNVAGDTAIEPDEQFTLSLAGPPGTSITAATATGTIRNDDRPVPPATYAIAATDADKPDSLSGTTPYTFKVTRSGDASAAATLNFAVAGSGANPADIVLFANPTGTISFAAGSTSASIAELVNGAAVTAAEGLTVTLSGPDGTEITTPSASGTIQANYGPNAGGGGGGGNTGDGNSGGGGGSGGGASQPPLSDVTLHGPHTEYVVALDPATDDAVIQDKVSGRDGTQTVQKLHDLVFTDGVGRFDATGNAEAMARLYKAALNRAPDAGGLDYWTGQVDGAHASLGDVASAFTRVPEFLSDYGSLSDTGFVQQLYQNVLGRAGEPGGVAYWQGILGSGTSRGVVLLSFAESAENRTNTLPTAGDKNDAAAYRLYQASLDRAPDPGGVAYWSGVLSGGASLADVAASFMNSSEFQAKYGTLDNTGFVSALYQNVLNRPPDTGGLQYWAGTLQGGQSRPAVLADFSDSLENRMQTATATHDAWVFVKP